MDKKKVAVPLVCHGHSRPVVDLFYSPVTPDGFFLISASKGTFFYISVCHCSLDDCLWIVSAGSSKRQLKDIVYLWKGIGFH